MTSIYPFVLAMQILVIFICLAAVHVSLNMSVNQGQKYMSTFLLAVTVQNIGALFELTQTTPEAALVAIRMQYTGSCYALCFFVQFCFYYFKAKIPKYFFQILTVLDTLILFAMWSCNYHPYFYSKMVFVYDEHPHYELTHGPLYVVFLVVCCIIPWFLSVGVAYYQAKKNPAAVIGKNWRLFIGSTFIPFSYLVFISIFTSDYDLTPMILGFMLATVVIFILSKNTYDINELTIKTMLEELDDGIVIFNSSGQLIQSNGAAEKMFGAQALKSFPEELHSFIKDDVEGDGIDRRVVKFNRQERIYECHQRKISDDKGAIIGYFFLILDTTDTENYIEQLKVLKEKADSANLAKSQFLSNMSHEIRTPMNSIIGITEILMREKWQGKDRDYLISIKNSGNALISIINDILDFSKIEAGSMEFIERNYELSSMLNDLTLMFLNRIGDKDVELLFDIDKNLPDMLYGDEVRVRQVLINLVNNAIKFTEHGHVKLTMKTEIIDRDIILHCQVEDTGTGIREQDLDHLFDAFKRVGLEENYNKEGTGLGLPISKVLVERMGGEIHVKSKLGEGSTFSFDLHQGYISEKPAVLIPNEMILDKNICALFSKEELYESFDAVLSQYGVTYKRYSHDIYSEALFDYLFLDVANYAELSSDIRNIQNRGVKIVLVQNPMVDQVSNTGLIVVNKPIYNNSLYNAILNNTSKVAKDETSIFDFEAPAAKILLVDDNEMNRKVAKELLKPLKLQIDEAIDGEKAIEALKNQSYSLVLMDHMMPVMDGIEATRVIRSKNNPYYKELPIIALTANAIVGVKDEFVEAGMNDFVSKPINIRELNRVIYENLPKSLICEKNAATKEQKVEQEEETFDFGAEIDVAEAIKNCGSKNFYYEMLGDFYKILELKAKKTESLLQEEMIRDYTIEVHALKNSARLIGALELSKEFYELEQLGNENQVEKLKELSPRVIEHYRSFKELLRPFADRANKSKHEISTEELKGLLNKLYDEVDAFDYDHADETMKALEEIQVPNEIFEKIEMLQAYMADVDMDNILNTISEIQGLLE